MATYFVKSLWIEQLEVMQDTLPAIEESYFLGECPEQFILGCHISDLKPLIDECYALETAAKTRKVSGREYGRIREIAEWRMFLRYQRNRRSR